MIPIKKFDGRNCIGPSAPAALAPSCTPGWFDCPLSDSTVPMAARIAQGRPGQVAAAAWYSASIAGGIEEVAADGAEGGPLPTPRKEAAEATTAVPTSAAHAPTAAMAPAAALIGRK